MNVGSFADGGGAGGGAGPAKTTPEVEALREVVRFWESPAVEEVGEFESGSTRKVLCPLLPEASNCSKIFFLRSGQDLSAATERTRFLFAWLEVSLGLPVLTMKSICLGFFLLPEGLLLLLLLALILRPGSQSYYLDTVVHIW